MLDLRLSASCCSWETCSGVSSSWWCSRSCSVWYTKARIGCWCFWMSLWKACKQIRVNACHILMIGRELHLIYMTVYRHCRVQWNNFPMHNLQSGNKNHRKHSDIQFRKFAELFSSFFPWEFSLLSYSFSKQPFSNIPFELPVDF